MSYKHKLNEIENYNIIILIFGLPIMIWAISTLSSFSPIEKTGLLIVLYTISIGISSTLLGLKLSKKIKTFTKKRYAMKDLNLSPLSLCSPQLIITLVLSGLCMGLLCYYLLEQHLSTFIFAGFTGFIMVLGVEYLYQDIIVQKSPKKHKKDIIQYIIKKLPLSLLLSTTIGIVICNQFLQNIEHIILGTLIFTVLGEGLKAFKSK